MTYDSTTADTDESLVVDATKGPRGSGDTFSSEQQLENISSDKARDADGRKEEEEDDEETTFQQANKSNKPSTSSSPSDSTSLADNLAAVSSSSSKQDVKSCESQDCATETEVAARVPDQLQQTGVAMKTTEPQAADSTKRSEKKEESELVSSLEESEPLICYDPVLDNEIRNRLDKLNALSDLINSLELRFDQANVLFRETLKCSTERLSTIAKTLGSKSIRQGRIYHAAKVSVEQSQTDCQRACVQFEQANNDHQFAKLAIKEAELKLKEINWSLHDDGRKASTSLGSINICGLKLEDDRDQDDGEENEKLGNSPEESRKECDNSNETNSMHGQSSSLPPTIDIGILHKEEAKTLSAVTGVGKQILTTASPELAEFVDKLDKDGDAEGLGRILNSAKLSEELNQAIVKLLDAEQKRRQSERMHLDQANKLMIAQENLTKLEREHGASIRRAQVYFEEARRFNAKLNSVKSDIARISEEIVGAKQAYARTLNELEQFSEDLHISSRNLLNTTRTETDS